jgi:hypothetical protein
MRISFSILLSFFIQKAFAGTPGMNDTTLIYALVLLVIGSVAGIGLIINWIKSKAEESKTGILNQSAEQEEDDNDYFSQTGF